MRKVKTNFRMTIAERFFLEKIFELLHRETIDSYRLRLHNPKTIIIELKNVLDDLKKNKLRNKNYAETLINETIRLVDEENELEFIGIRKSYFRKIIDQKKNGGSIDFSQIFYGLCQILLDNKKYLEKLFDSIQLEINRINNIDIVTPIELKDLNRMVGYLFVELKNLGYSKTYLHRFSRAVFSGPRTNNFQDGFNALKTLIERELEMFSIIVGLKISDDLKSKIHILSDDFKPVKSKYLRKISGNTNDKIKGYFESNVDLLFIKSEVLSNDYYSATKLVRSRLHYMFDILHMGHSDKKINLHQECVVIGSVDPSKANIQNIEYKFDGYFRSNQNLYKQFIEQLQELKQKEINPNALSKIYSGLRYLRLGTETTEVENKLLNYWIGLEYMFSLYDSESYTVGRLRDYYKKCHATIYIKRLLSDFHLNIKNVGLSSSVDGFDDNLEYLLNQDTYSHLMNQIAEFPLLAYRAYILNEHRTNPDKIIGTLEKHQKNVDWNLNRIYRIRNEIVHNAAINLSIESIVSHLRYYLVFILNAAIDFLLNEPVDINNDGVLDLEDFYILQDIRLQNLIHDKKISFDLLLKIKNPVEYLT